jgi:hypothetical protein
MKKILIAVVLGMLFFAAQNGFSQTSPLPPPDYNTAPLPPPFGPVQATPSTPAQTTPSAPAQAAPSTPAQAAPATPAQTTPSVPAQATPSVPAQAVPSTPAEAAPSAPALGVQGPDKNAWKNKRWYLGGFVGGGFFTWEEEAYYAYEEDNTHTKGLFAYGLQVEWSLLSWFALEIDLGGTSIEDEEDAYLVIPVLAKIGGRPGPVELFADFGYSIGGGLTFGLTMGFHLGPGILFGEALYMIGDNNTFIGTVGYKVGLGRRK